MTRKSLQIQHISKFPTPLYLLLNVQSKIIGMYLTTQETQEAIMKMIRCLKSHTLCWRNTRVIMTDKDFAERSDYFAASSHFTDFTKRNRL